MTIPQVPVGTAATRAADTRAAQAIGLAGEHAKLLRQVAVRAEAPPRGPGGPGGAGIGVSAVCESAR